MSNVPETVGVANPTVPQTQPVQTANQQMNFNPAAAANSAYPPGLNVASLYVGELKPEITEQILWNVFSSHGQVMSVKVCRDSQSQVSLGYAYVNFRSNQEAERAMEQVNFTCIDGKPCRVMWSMRDSSKRKFGSGNLFIKNIDPNLDAKSLYQAFSSFGPVLSCKIALDEYGLSKGYGFIQFYNEADANKARERSNGVKFSKKKLVVTKFIPKNERKDAKPYNPDEFTNVFVKNFSKEWTDVILRKRFEKFGEITSCVVQKNDKGDSLCYGFVNFLRHEFAHAAIREMNDSTIENGNKITVCRAMKKMERQAFLRRQYEERKREIFKKYQNMNLYVKNFDESVTDDKLRAMFQEFGEIKSAHVMKDDTNRSRCFGFVCFSKPEEAERALTSMNMKVIEGRPLYVSHAQSKEERRKSFEQQAYNTSFRGPIITPQGMQFIYPPPGAFPYPAQPQFQRYQQPGSRMPSRSMQQGGMPPGQPFMGQNPRIPYYGQANPGFGQSNYRPRNGQIGSRPNAGNFGVRHQNTAQQVSVNSVATNPVVSNTATESQSAKPKESKPMPKTGPVDPKTDFKNKIFMICQSVFAQNGYDSNLIPRVTGLVIDYLTLDSNAHNMTEEKDIREAVMSAYSSLMAEESSAR